MVIKESNQEEKNSNLTCVHTEQKSFKICEAKTDRTAK